jgi:CheY-like chemotaxis protein
VANAGMKVANNSIKDMFNILVIDHDADLRETLRRCLAKLGCDVSTAETSESGMEKMQSGQYDAVFASLCLQTLGGRGMARWVKTNNINNDTKFFITTSWKGDLELDMLRFDGIHDVIRKPFVFNEIRDKVLEHLG